MYQKGQYIVYGIRGVCEISDIIIMEPPDSRQRRLYYELHPYYQKGSRIVVPVDSGKTVIRPLVTREEAVRLIDEIPQIREMNVETDKQREARYKAALNTCDCRVWISMIKALYVRKQDRLRQGKNMTDLDQRYFRTAGENLHSELALALGVSREEMAECIRSRVKGEK